MGYGTNSISGGNLNVIGGGWNNQINNGAFEATIAGGYYNTVGAEQGAIGGGEYNTVSGSDATVPGGYYNVAGGFYSFAAGYQAQALHNGAFVWADSSGGDFCFHGREPIPHSRCRRCGH